VPWLSESKTQFTLSPGARTTVAVTLNAGDPSVSQPATYTAALDISTNTPYLTPPVGVTLNAQPPATWGKITGIVSGTSCSATASALTGAEVNIIGSTAGRVLITGASGSYELWIDQSQSPLTVIASLDNWQAQVATVPIQGRKTATVNFALTPMQC
jgi:hypothetical protein